MTEVIRVIRILEYTYDTAERMIDDRTRWAVKEYIGRPTVNGMSIKSTVMVPELVEVPDND